MIGRTLSRYRILEKLGEGGMGVVFKAHDGQLDRSVAIKILPGSKVADPMRKQRFVREAKAASPLNHPNIVTIYEISYDDVDFIVMEYVDRRTLDKLIGAKGLRLGQGLQYAVQIADALTGAHAAGIMHRDVKPSNIMVTDDESIKVLDFGLAKLAPPPESPADGTTLSAGALTEEGAAVGTASYMSPEQAEARKLDARSDVFCFGSVLYEMTTGAGSSGETRRSLILAKILNEDPTPSAQLSGSVSPELEKIILRCLRKDPARRYQTMADLKVALQDLQEEPGRRRRVHQPALRPRWAWAALLPVLVGAGLFGWRLKRTPENTEPLKLQLWRPFPVSSILLRYRPTVTTRCSLGPDRIATTRTSTYNRSAPAAPCN